MTGKAAVVLSSENIMAEGNRCAVPQDGHRSSVPVWKQLEKDSSLFTSVPVCLPVLQHWGRKTNVHSGIVSCCRGALSKPAESQRQELGPDFSAVEEPGGPGDTQIFESGADGSLNAPCQTPSLGFLLSSPALNQRSCWTLSKSTSIRGDRLASAQLCALLNALDHLRRSHTPAHSRVLEKREAPLISVFTSCDERAPVRDFPLRAAPPPPCRQRVTALAGCQRCRGDTGCTTGILNSSTKYPLLSVTGINSGVNS
ncbi:unnamed protein product [Pleuronectes platessa]|uniref:Uncharacterized protein n=1 Tax=Pleuronectes platessa TaxID=8262 RepID=A0A9N7TM77_PLEPL|nr:unnamed protein product [Pleuronectes platessa]